MRKYLTLMIVVLFLGISKSHSQLVENDSLLTINQDFKFLEIKDQYYLIPNFNSKCFKKGIKFKYDYFKGALEGKIPIQYYVKSYPKLEKNESNLSNIDTIVTIYFVGSKSTKYYEVKVQKNSPDIILTFYNPNGNICEIKDYPKTRFHKLIMENFIISLSPPYDTYSKITLIKNFQ